MTQEQELKEMGARLSDAVEYVKQKNGILNEREITDRMGSSPSALSQAKRGVKGCTTRKYMIRFSAEFPEISSSWLIYGTGAMLAGDNNTNTQVVESTIIGDAHVENVGGDANVNCVCPSSLIKTIETRIKEDGESIKRLISIIEKMQGI